MNFSKWIVIVPICEKERDTHTQHTYIMLVEHDPIKTLHFKCAFAVNYKNRIFFSSSLDDNLFNYLRTAHFVASVATIPTWKSLFLIVCVCRSFRITTMRKVIPGKKYFIIFLKRSFCLLWNFFYFPFLFFTAQANEVVVLSSYNIIICIE